jgi:hypothetical protein
LRRNGRGQEARVEALGAVESADYRRCASCAEGIGKLSAVTGTTAGLGEAAAALATIAEKLRARLQQLLDDGEEKFREGLESSDSAEIFNEVNSVMKELKEASKALKSAFPDIVRDCTEGRLVQTM